MGKTIGDVARRSGVSASTVSAVINNNYARIRVSAKTRQKVLAAARRLDYRPSFSARALARGKTFSLGLVCGDIHTPFFSELASIALEESEARGYHLLTAVTRWDPQKELACVDTLLERKVDGFLMGPASLQPGTRQYDYIMKNRIPVVGLLPPVPGFPHVTSDWREGMEEAVRHLTGKGYDRIGFIDLPGIYPVEPHRACKRSVFLETIGRVGAVSCEYNCVIDLHNNREIGRNLADLPDRPRAFIVGSDYMAMGLVRGFRDGGLDVPRDVAVVGMDGTAMGEFFHPPLTTIAQDIRQLVGRALELLVTMIEEKTLTDQEMWVPTRLIVRDSA